MFVPSTSLVVVNPVQRSLKRRKSPLLRQGYDAETGFQPGLPTPKDDVIDAEFYEMLGEAVNLPPANGNGYDDVITPKFLLKSRFINYYV
jgi:hypothetical protein